MSKYQPAFALIGRSFPIEVFEPLYEASLKARLLRLGQATAWDNGRRGDRVWRGSGERVAVPMRLPVTTHDRV